MLFFKKDDLNERRYKWLQHGVAIFFIFILLITAFYFGFEKTYSQRIYPKISIAGIAVGGSTRAEASDKLNNIVQKINESGISFNYKDKKTLITPVISSLGGDIAFPIINFNIDKTVETAFSIGRQGNFLNDLSTKIRSLLYEKNLKLQAETEEEQIIKILEENYKKIEEKGLDAALTATTTWNAYREKEIIFNILPEKNGFTMDYRKAAQELKNNLLTLNVSPIEIEANEDLPKIKQADCANAVEEASQIINKDPLVLTYENNRWIIDDEILSSWLMLKPGIGNLIIVGLDENKIGEYLKENIAKDIEREPKNARFEIKENRVIEFETSQNGVKIDPIRTTSMISTNFLVGTSTDVEIITNTVESEVKTESVNDLGIKEIIGTGHSNFSGSPKNRIHNINNGASSVSGILIAPDEEFSLMNALGEIDAKSGYLTELVIKGNRTVPEYGGGLCQIGTTIFRTALRSGLPITARRNHSYRVSYYEPAGTDATIYDPWPDLKFLNDTGHHILIQHRIDGNDLYFDFWGTRDGRKIEVTDPTIYNIVGAGPTKIIETTDLAPGEKRCTESAHAGADAYFDYKVTYPDGEIKEERFSSHYVPWQAVCLVGIEEKIEENTSSSTPETSD